MKEYLTVLKPQFGEYEEKRSKFISGVYPCSDEQTAFKILSDVKLANFGANHNVYAFALKDNFARYSDDGEPHGTAGMPVLEVINGAGLKDVLIVVTRYFGGTLLGTGGLVRAYTSAAKDALLKAQTVKMCESVFYKSTFDYSFLSKMQSLITECGGKIENTVFSEKVTVDYVFPCDKAEDFLNKLTETFSSKIAAEFQKNAIFPFDF